VDDCTELAVRSTDGMRTLRERERVIRRAWRGERGSEPWRRGVGVGVGLALPRYPVAERARSPTSPSGGRSRRAEEERIVPVHRRLGVGWAGPAARGRSSARREREMSPLSSSPFGGPRLAVAAGVVMVDVME
jgi:hypothetical protein